MIQRHRLLALILISAVAGFDAAVTYAQDLHVFMTADQEVVGPGDYVTYTLTASNTGTEALTDVQGAVRLPEHIGRLPQVPDGFTCTGGCDADEIHPWSVGTLSPGETRATSYRARISPSAPAATAGSSIILSAGGASDVAAALDVAIDPSPMLRLGIAPLGAPVAPGGLLTYTITYGNVGGAAATGVELMMAIPDGAAYVSDSRDGSVDGTGLSWNIGTIGVGASGRVDVTVRVDENALEGHVLRAEAEIDPDNVAEPVGRSSVASPVRSGVPLNIAHTISETTLEPRGMVTYMITASNTGDVALTDVQVDVLFPAFISRLPQTPPGFSCTAGCDGNERHPWNVGTLPPGESRTTFFRTSIATNAPQGEIMRSVLLASSSATGQVHAALDAAVDPAPLLRLSLAPENGPAVPGRPLTYTMTIGNTGNQAATEVQLRVPVPEHASFSSASSGGVLQSGTVVWDLGTLGVGASRRVELTVMPDEGLANGTLIRARAELFASVPTYRPVRSTAATPVRAGVPLNIAYTMSESTLEPGGMVTYMITASNTGDVALTDVQVDVLFPAFISRLPQTPPGFSCTAGCDGNERHPWSIGALPPGESRTTYFRTRVPTNAPQGDLMRSLLLATSSATGQVQAALDAAVDPSPLLRLSLAPNNGPGEPGRTLSYTVTIGNTGNTAATEVELHMPVPEHTTFSSASYDGVLEDGAVVWRLGTLGVGASRRVELNVMPDAATANGTIIRASAELRSTVPTYRPVRATAATPVRAGVPLNVAYTISETTLKPGGTVTYMLTASNTDDVALTDVQVEVLLPGFISRLSQAPTGFSCIAGCDGDERHVWNVGALPPGESRMTFFRTRIPTNAPQGELLRSMLLATSSATGQVQAALDGAVHSSPMLRMSLAADGGPVAPGSRITYTITFGNIGNAAATEPVIRLRIPEGTSYDGASRGGLLRDGEVVWEFEPIGVERGGQVSAVVEVDEFAEPGAVIRAFAQAESGVSTERDVHATAATPVAVNLPVAMTLAVDDASVMPGDAPTFTVTSGNAGAAELADVEAQILLPSFIDRLNPVPPEMTCTSGCDADERHSWVIGSLLPQQSRSMSFAPRTSNNAPQGDVMATIAHLTASGRHEIIAQRDVFIGNLVEPRDPNRAPTAAFITSPPADTVVVIGAPVGAEPLDPETSFLIEWGAATDPDGDALTYRWQLSDTEHFGTVRLESDSDDDGSATHYTVTFGALAQVLRSLGLDYDDQVTLYHRIIASDGRLSTTGAHLPLTLIRGRVVSIEQREGVPIRFALHPNYPNPFNPSTTIRFDLPTAGTATITIFDALGRRVAVAFSGEMPAGTHEFTWDARGLPSGLYVYRLEAGESTGMRKMLLLK